MPDFAFRARILLLTPAMSADSAARQTQALAEVLSRVPYGKSMTSVCLTALADRIEPDPLGSGFACPIEGHVRVQAEEESAARGIVRAWKQIIEINLARQGMAFQRFDLHSL